MKSIILIFFITIIFPNILVAKTVKGKVLNLETQDPIPFVNIAIPDTYLGTISNAEGNFILNIPNKYLNRELVFSCIGYANDTISISQIKSWCEIKLEPQTHNIAEIKVMPDSTLITILKRAYNKIPENYPDFASRYTGFYRSSMKQKDSTPIYFAEAILDVFKDSYKRKNEKGQVKIVNSRKYLNPVSDTLFPVSLYGGVHMPIWNDPVYDIKSFINPKYFKNYKYQLNTNQYYQNREIIGIRFEAINGMWQGEFYIDKETFAYVYFAYSFTNKGIENRNKQISDLICKQRDYVILFDKYENKYFLKSIWDEEIFISGQSELINTDEFVSTEVYFDSVSPIPYNEQVAYSTVISRDATDYFESDWKDYNILKNSESFLDESIDATAKILEKSKPKEITRKEKITNILLKLQVDYSIGMQTITTNSTNVSAVYYNQGTDMFTISTSLPSEDNVKYIKGGVAYKLTPNWKIGIYFSNGIGKNYYSKTSFGIGYHNCIKNRGKQWFADATLNISQTKYGLLMGEIDDIKSSFSFGGKKIDAEKIEIYTGGRGYYIHPGINISTRIREFFKVFAGTEFPIAINTKGVLSVKESSGFILTRKTGGVKLSDDSLEYYQDGTKVNSSGVKAAFPNLFFGIRFEL